MHYHIVSVKILIMGRSYEVFDAVDVALQW